ncbi:MAG: PAS domain-containing protein [SAR324 cluster bacterium]|nr:PAS domain-containing protein [SAR324 cluster bacterium]
MEIQIGHEDSLKFVQSILNALSSHIAILDHEGKIIAVNNAWIEFGKQNGFDKISYGLGTNYLQVCQEATGDNSEEAKEIESGILAVMRQSIDKATVEYPCHGPTEKRWFSVKISRFEMNRKVWVVVAHENITEKKLVEQQVQIRDHAMQSIAEGITITNPHLPDNPIVYANPGFEQITRYSPDEVIGKNCRFLQGAQTESASLESIRNAIEKQQACLVELQNYRKDGKMFWNRLSITPVRDENGLVTHFVGVQSDVTQQKQYEQQLQNSQAELREMNANKDKLFSIISHDLKSPFHSIMGFAEIFSNDLQDYSYEDLQEFGNHVYSAAKNLYGLLENLLQWSQIQTGKMEYNPVILDASEIVSSVVGLLQGNALQKNIDLVSDLQGDGSIKVDLVMLQLIFQNLISNSLKFTKPGGRVKVSSLNKKNFVELLVSDNGIGISSEQLSSLFTVGEQVSTLGTAQEKGTGLGLILCKELIEKNGGQIEVESEPGKGTQFRICFPLAEPIHDI